MTPLETIQAEYKRQLGQFDSFPSPADIIAALEAAGYKIVKFTDTQRRHLGFDCNNHESPGGDPSPF